MQMAVYKRPSGTAAKTKSAPKDTKEEDTSQPSEVPTAEAPAETPTEGEKANTEKEKPTEKEYKGRERYWRRSGKPAFQDRIFGTKTTVGPVPGHAFE